MAKAPSYVACFLALICLQAAVAAPQRPNILLIVADDIGFSDFGAFGGEIDTPNIDALASAGVRFSNFHAAASCAPTRAMLMTGLDSHRAGIGSMRELMPLSHRGKPGYGGVLSEGVETIASRMQSSGYRTLVAGKWHLGDDARNLPPARGFDYSVIQADSGSDNFEMRPYLPMKPEVFWYEGGRRMHELPEGFYSSTFFVDKAIEFLEADSSADAPFFAYLAFQANHTPVQAPAAFIDRYRGRYTQGWAKVREARIRKIREYGLLPSQASLAAGPTQADWDSLDAGQQYFEARRMQAYAGMASAMDHEIGRLLAYLRESGQYDNTIFVVFSDNGATGAEPYENAYGRRWLERHYHREVESLGEKGSWVAAGRQWGRVSNTPLSGYKFSAGEGGVRVPLIISGLPSIRPGEVSREFVYITDLAVTLLDIAGLAPPRGARERGATTARSLLPQLQGDSRPLRGRGEAVGYEFSGNAALYRGDFKLTRNLPPAGDGQWRLYHISDDPGETNDLSARRPQLFQQMQDEYANYAETHGVLDMPENYSLVNQVAINMLLFHYLPGILPYLALFLVLAAAVVCYRVLRRER
jgi:arylsulfatase A-like enzyme